VENIEELIDIYGKKVFNLAFRVTGNREDAEDVVQETFLQVHKNLDNFRGESSVYTWIYKIALNNCLKAKKVLDKAYVESLDEKIEIFKDDIPNEVQEWYNDPEKAVLINDLLGEIRHGCMHFLSFRLPENQRVVYILRNVLGFSYKEISEILEISENVIKARLSRARENLLEFFGNRCQWLTENNTCTCKSRIGFALAFDTEMLKRVKMQAYEAGLIKKSDMKHVASQSIDELFKKFPLLEYKVKDIKEKIASI
jgi:RNA polymerase sigma-70 factor, ECF subfamily